MKLEDVHSQKNTTVRHVAEQTALYLNGSVEPDHDQNYFRLYRDPYNHRSYFLVRKSDVVGDLYAWTNEETVRVGLVGVTLFRVPLKHGTEVQVVSITVETLGETIAADTSATDVKTMSRGTCVATGGCASKPC